MKILVDEMYDGIDEKLRNKGYDAQSVKKLINSGMKIKSDFSVLTYTKNNDMILITADIENKNGCVENGIKCICPTTDKLLHFILEELKNYVNQS